MAQELFKVSTKYDSTFSTSDKIRLVINEMGCTAFATRAEGGVTITVKVNNNGEVTENTYTWEAGTDPKLQEALAVLIRSLQQEMINLMLGNGDHNGSVTFSSKKTM